MKMLDQPTRRRIYRHLHGFNTCQQLLDAELVAHRILPHIQRGIINHTAHDVGHSVRVIEYINKLVVLIRHKGVKLSQAEVLALLIAAWLHDIGNLSKGDRSCHSDESCRMITKLSTTYLRLGAYGRPVNYVVRYHQAHLDIGAIPNEEYMINGERVRLRLVCSIFRIADDCDMGEERANDVVYLLIKDQLSDLDKKHWRSNKAILSVDFDAEKEVIQITVSSKRNANFMVNDFRRKFKRVKPYIGDFIPLRDVVVKEIPKSKLR
jgi:hypothetical protein